MIQKLFYLYNNLKRIFVSEITDIVKHKGGEIVFNSIIKINRPCNMFDEIACLKFDEEEKTLYVHLMEVQIEASSIEQQEYWIPLIDMSIDDIYKIAEKL